VLVQLVEIPGLLEGATDDRGGGRALLGVLRGADAIVFCQDATASPDELLRVRAEVEEADILPPSILAVTKMDEADERALERIADAFPDLELVPVSVLDDDRLAALRDAIWSLTGLVRIFLRHAGVTEPKPAALRPPVTVADVARSIHHDLEAECRGAHLWGPSARFEGQRVGRDHVLADGDTVEILTRG
jgi:ribosome-interacting GTPase 1